ncbi:MAG TPA: ABC transporter permease [Bacillota bacterium]
MKRRRRRDWAGPAAAAFLGLVVTGVLFGNLLMGLDPYDADLRDRFLPPLSPGHVLGTDGQGRDLLARMLDGGRVSLLVGVASVVGAGVVGTLLGVIAGYFGGWVDQAISAVIDAQMSFPFLVLVLTINAVLGPSVTNIIVTLVVASWVYYARMARGETLRIRELEFVGAATAAGASSGRVLLRHVLPNALPPLIVLASLEMARMILAEAAVSFLGFGIQPPTPAWGSMIAEGRNYLLTAWWMSTIPGAMLLLTALSINVVGDWLGDAIDPKRRNR